MPRVSPRGKDVRGDLPKTWGATPKVQKSVVVKSKRVRAKFSRRGVGETAPQDGHRGAMKLVKGVPFAPQIHSQVKK